MKDVLLMLQQCRLQLWPPLLLSRNKRNNNNTLQEVASLCKVSVDHKTGVGVLGAGTISKNESIIADDSPLSLEMEQGNK